MDFDMASTSSPLPMGIKIDSDSPQPHSIKARILSGQYKIINSDSKTKVWSTYGHIQNHLGQKLKNVVACKKCSSVLKLNEKGTSNLQKHKCYVIQKFSKVNSQMVSEFDDETKEQGAHALAGWAVENCRSFKLLQDSGLNTLASFFISVGAKYGDQIDLESLLPQPATLSRNIAGMYENCVVDVKTELAEVLKDGYAVTTGMWTDNFLKKCYIATTIHYIKDGQLRNRFLGFKSMKSDKSTGENIKLKVANTLSEFDCELNDNTIIVTDRGANMKPIFLANNHICCINRLLNNTVEKSLNDVPQLADLCNLCTNLVKYLKKCDINSKLQQTLKSFPPTRWNKTYYLLSSIEKNWVEISTILQERNEMETAENINLVYIHEILRLLSFFQETSKKLEADNIPTLHWVYIHIHRLKKICNVNTDDIAIVKAFKAKLNHYLDEIVLNNITICHKVALFLFPPINKLKQFSPSEKNVILTECKKFMKYFAENTSEESQSSSPRISSFNSDLLTDFLGEETTVNYDEKIDCEMRLYENTDVGFHDDFDILQWWNSHRAEFPLLHKVSCKLLATPASSIAFEETFSVARNIISEEMSDVRSNFTTAKQIMFLHFNMHNKTYIKNEFEQMI